MKIRDYKVFVIGLVTAQQWSSNCPKIDNPPLPEGAFMDQIELPCHNNLYGKIFYTCYEGRWNILEECRCKSELDSYGFRWWGVKVNKTETLNTNSGPIHRFCQSSGWGNYDASAASKCKGFDIYPDTIRGNTINMCASNEGSRNIFCDIAGKWIYNHGECFCPQIDGWDKILENTVQQRSCGSNIEYRSCESSGIWGFINSTQCYCPATSDFPATSYNITNSDNRCDNGVTVHRKCNAYGIWESITYDSLCKCTTLSGPQDGLVGDKLSNQCSFGRVDWSCTEVGHWHVDLDSCKCAATGVWPESLPGVVHETSCQNGGVLRRTCGTNGYWETVQDFNCLCPAQGIWSSTKPGVYARSGCSNGYIRRLCGDDGNWSDEYDRSACYCAPQNGWMMTLNNNTSTRACPAGEMTRTCSEFGVWGSVDYSNCMCKEQDGFLPTPVNTVQTAVCFDADGVPDPTHLQTRACDANGEWGAVDQTECSNKWCPTEPGWYKVPVELRPVTVVVGCMSGYRSRVCNINGVWGSVDVSKCDCTYISNNLEVLLRPSQSYQISCGIGARVYHCNDLSGFFDPVDITTCQCASDGRFPNTSAGELASAACAQGTATRVCDMEGVWESVNNSLCFCAADGVWPKITAGSSTSVVCDVGSRSRVCAVDGTWDAPIQSECRCSEDGRNTQFGNVVIETCDEGAIKYACGQDGHFAPADASTCFCSSKQEFGNIWNRIPAGSESSAMVCMNGVTVRRMCGATTGQWEDVSSSCGCTTEGLWAAAAIGEYSTASCSAHSTGMSRRMCYGNMWGPVDESTCVKECFYDRGNGETGYIPLGESKMFPCYINFLGNVTISCERDSVTGQSVLRHSSSCFRAFCVSEFAVEPFDAGATEIVACAAGYNGMRTRVCGSTGMWSDFDETHCDVIICKATVVDGLQFPEVLAGVDSEVPCDVGYAGVRRLRCEMNGVWATTVVPECTRRVCLAEGIWPETLSMMSATMPCPAEYTGMWTRMCSADGVWASSSIPSSCIPIKPIMKTIPYEGMTDVSRAPSGSLFSSIAMREPFISANCAVTIVSIEDANDVYTLSINSTKMALRGKYNNGGVFADFVLPEDADVYDLGNYLRFGEYKLVFPPCWTALNGAIIPSTRLEIKFRTTAIPPSAPTSIVLVPGDNNFSVQFEKPKFVDDPYPVVAYYLSFQPPVLPEVRVGASERSFGPFEYLPGHVTLLLRAENAYGMTSPDVEVQYDLASILSQPSAMLHVEAPVLNVVSQETSNDEVVISVSVSTTVQSSRYYDMMVLVCNNEEFAVDNTIYSTVYSFIVPSNQTTADVSCHYVIRGTVDMIGDVTMMSITVVSGETSYSAVTVHAEEYVSQMVRLTWSKPDIYSLPIASYVVQCRRDDQSAYSEPRFVTSQEFIVSAVPYMPGPFTCRVAASSDMTVPATAAWGEVTIRDLHVIRLSDINFTVTPKDVVINVDITTPYCIKAIAYLYDINQQLIADENMICSADKMSLHTEFTKLTPETSYIVKIWLPTFDAYDHLSVKTTVASTLGMTVDVIVDSITSTSATVAVTVTRSDDVFCVARTGMVDNHLVLRQMHSGMFDDGFTLVKTGVAHQQLLYDLQPITEYTVACVARGTESVHVVSHLFKTLVVDVPLRVVSVIEDHQNTRLPFLQFTFNDRIEIGAVASVTVSCGGRTMSLPLWDTAVINHVTLTVDLTANGIFAADVSCHLSFQSLDTVHRLHAAPGSGLLSATPFNGNKSCYDIKMNSDDMEPVLKAYAMPHVADDWVTIASVSEIALHLNPSDYQVRCEYKGEETVLRVFSMAEHPFKFNVSPNAPDGIPDIAVYTGILPNLHSCTLKFPRNSIRDASGNRANCGMPGSTCAMDFISRMTNPEGLSVEIVDVLPANNANHVAVTESIFLLFNVEVKAEKDVLFRCPDCVEKSVMIPAVCDGLICMMTNTKEWESDRTYYITYDKMTFHAAWDSVYHVPSMRPFSFSTAASTCNMKFVAEGWSDMCSCVNTGTHCQCNCGATAILKAF